MRILAVILLMLSFQLKAQIVIDPYVVGEYRDDVIYVGSYAAPGNCTFNDGTDFMFNFSGLSSPDGLEYVLIVDEPSPSNVVLTNGWAFVNVGDSTVFDANTTILGLSAASGPATINFHIRVVGTPTTSGQDYPCWIDAGVTEALCGNVYSLYPGESLVPCSVTPSVGIDDINSAAIDIQLNRQNLAISSDQTGIVSVFTLEGKLLISKKIDAGFNTFGISSIAEGTYIVQFEGQQTTVSKKILLQ